jgi:hypothetical protein
MGMRERFQVTKDLIKKLLGLIDGEGGLEDGSGAEGSSMFCVQQAVSLATGQPGADDQPVHCVMKWIIQLGIHLNDANGWESDESRAEGLRQFAVAELGSNTLREGSFRRELAKKAAEKWPDAELSVSSSTGDYVFAAEEDDGETGLRALAQMVVDVLVQMKSPGSEYLCMADKKAYEKPEGFGRIPTIKPATPSERESAWLPEDAPWV